LSLETSARPGAKTPVNPFSQNQVRLAGKVSRIGPLKYSPSGVPVREGLLAVNQNALGTESVGYFDLLFFGDIAEQEVESLRIGTALSIQGALWSRSYRNRKGVKVTELKIIVESFERGTGGKSA
jgi:single-stranded DNA-binding protein